MRLGSRVLPLRPDTSLQIDYRARTPGFARLSARDILCDEFVKTSARAAPCDDARRPADELFRDRIVLIGATNNDAPDLFVTPYYESMALPRAVRPGVADHARADARRRDSRQRGGDHPLRQQPRAARATGRAC